MSLWEDFFGVLIAGGKSLSFTISRSFAWTGWTQEKMGNYKYFTDEEISGLDLELCAMLDRARGLAGVPFQITCGVRTPEQNAALPESVKDSAHLTGHAVDLACEDSGTRYNMIRGLILSGFNRIGIYSAHIHADNSPTLPPNVCWYVEGT